MVEVAMERIGKILRPLENMIKVLLLRNAHLHAHRTGFGMKYEEGTGQSSSIIMLPDLGFSARV